VSDAALPHRGTEKVGRLWRETDGTARVVGVVVTRRCTHWDTVGPHAFPAHVNPEPRVQWRLHLDADVSGADPFDDVYSDDAAAPALDLDGAPGSVVVHGVELTVEWLDGADADAVWSVHGW